MCVECVHLFSPQNGRKKALKHSHLNKVKEPEHYRKHRGSIYLYERLFDVLGTTFQMQS
jgi:hypothetical protein